MFSKRKFENFILGSNDRRGITNQRYSHLKVPSLRSRGQLYYTGSGDLYRGSQLRNLTLRSKGGVLGDFLISNCILLTFTKSD